jgi:histidyl-tRNA synthetase
MFQIITATFLAVAIIAHPEPLPFFIASGIPCDVFLDEAKLPKQYMLGEKKGLKWLIIPDEGVSGSLTLRNLETRENREGVRVEDVVGMLKG